MTRYIRCNKQPCRATLDLDRGRNGLSDKAFIATHNWKRLLENYPWTNPGTGQQEHLTIDVCPLHRDEHEALIVNLTVDWSRNIVTPSLMAQREQFLQNLADAEKAARQRQAGQETGTGESDESAFGAEGTA